MNRLYELIEKPLLTEKSTRIRENYNQYCFKVNEKANKIEIQKAIEKIFNVKVVKVNKILSYGKKKRLGKYEGRRPDWVKAIVTLKEGDKIDIY